MKRATLKVNKAPLEKLVEKLEGRKLEVITGNEAFALLAHILEEVNFTPKMLTDISRHFRNWCRFM